MEKAAEVLEDNYRKGLLESGQESACLGDEIRGAKKDQILKGSDLSGRWGFYLGAYPC